MPSADFDRRLRSPAPGTLANNYTMLCYTILQYTKLYYTIPEAASRERAQMESASKVLRQWSKSGPKVVQTSAPKVLHKCSTGAPKVFQKWANSVPKVVQTI
eukprot:7075846-Heterocapsa_arctica.AAC.1